MTGQAYAGDVTSLQAWDILKEDAGAVLVDVRTTAEWQFVGLPDLRSLGRGPACVPWQVYPDMAVNPEFASQVAAQGVARDATVLLLCRSGQRSRNAAIALTELGFKRCFNIADGFEGPLDDDRQRGRQSGWKAAGLPWFQH